MKSTTKQEKHFRLKPFLFHRLAALVALLLVSAIVFTGCDNEVVPVGTETTQPANNHMPSTDNALNVGYSEEDSLNPFFMTTDINSDIVSLVFEPLFYLDDSFMARNGLAVSYTQNTTSLTVTLDTTAAFSDGVQFSSADVLYSFNMAKESSKYRNELSSFLSAAATAADTIVFTLKESQRNAVDSLTFPVVKSSTAGDKDAAPVGTGLYSYNLSGERIKLEYNPYCRKPQPNIGIVNLMPITSASTLIHTLELGTIDAFFDDFSQGSYSQANAQTARTNLSNLVFLGMNCNSYGLNTAEVRQAVYFSINRQAIAKESFKNYAVASSVPYHPEWHVLSESETDISHLTLDYSSAKSLLKEAGVQGTVNYALIVYSGNNFKVAAAKEIQKSLKNVGINVTIRELTWDDYIFALQNNAYDLYIGEIKLPGNMDMTSLFSKNSPVYGISAADTTDVAYAEFRNGNISIEAFMQSYLQNMPFAPICFRLGALFYSDSITPAADCDINNAYKNVYEWDKIIP